MRDVGFFFLKNYGRTTKTSSRFIFSINETSFEYVKDLSKRTVRTTGGPSPQQSLEKILTKEQKHPNSTTSTAATTSRRKLLLARTSPRGPLVLRAPPPFLFRRRIISGFAPEQSQELLVLSPPSIAVTLLGAPSIAVTLPVGSSPARRGEGALLRRRAPFSASPRERALPSPRLRRPPADPRSLDGLLCAVTK